MDRSILYHRHQLSHQQIDDFLGNEGSRGFRETKAQMLVKLNDFLGVSKLFSEAGIAFIPLKGFLLSQRIYEDPSYRITGDFDLLIKPDWIPLAIRVLSANGYQPVKFDWPESPVRQKKVLHIINQYPMVHKDTGVYIELHWRLFRKHLVSQKRLDAIIEENLEETRLAGQTFRQFNHELELLYLVIHGGLHAWRRLKWLVDVHELLERFPLDEEKFRALARKLKARRLVALCNAMLHEFFPGSKGLPSKQKAHPFLLAFSRECIYSEQDDPSKNFSETLKRARFKLTAITGWRYRITAFRFSNLTQKEVNENLLPPFPLIIIFDRLLSKMLKK